MDQTKEHMYQNVIFFDVDGVLNSDEFLKRHRCDETIINMEHVKVLKQIVDQTNASIILSSSWKCGWSKEEIDPFCKPLVEALASAGLEIVDKVPEFIGKEKEISQWLLSHPSVKGILILDDNLLHLAAYHLEPYFLQTQYYGPAGGLREEHINTAVEILNKAFCFHKIR